MHGKTWTPGLRTDNANRIRGWKEGVHEQPEQQQQKSCSNATWDKGEMSSRCPLSSSMSTWVSELFFYSNWYAIIERKKCNDNAIWAKYSMTYGTYGEHAGISNKLIHFEYGGTSQYFVILLINTLLFLWIANWTNKQWIKGLSVQWFVVDKHHI